MGHILLDGGFEPEVRYLLHRMEPEERDAFSQHLLEDQEASDRVREAELELYDAFARGRLPAQLEEDFRRRLLSTTAGKQRLATARALAARSPRTRVAPAAFLALAAGVVLGFIGLPRWLHQRQAQQSEQWALSPAQTRAPGSVKEFNAPQTETVTIRFPWTESAPLRVELKRGEAGIWTSVVTARDGELLLTIPAPALRNPGRYELTLTQAANGELAGFTEFRVRGPDR